METTVSSAPAFPDAGDPQAAGLEHAGPNPVGGPSAVDVDSAASPASATEPCAHCGATLAHDQRYCLECGAPRTFLSGLQQLDGLRAAAGGSHPAYPVAVHPAMAYGAPPPSPYAYPPAGAHPGGSRWGGPAGLIAGVGVLLLAIGVGVLIGRSGANATKGASAPPAQVITVEGSGVAGSTAENGEGESSGSGSSQKHGSKKASHKSEPAAKAGSGKGVGEAIEKPAPPTVLKNEKSKTGGSFEQKSKNLPNVISTG